MLVDLVADDPQVVLLDHGPAIAVSSSRVNTDPVGLCGELSSSRRVRGVIAARSASASGRKSPAVSGTSTRVPPARLTAAA